MEIINNGDQDCGHVQGQLDHVTALLFVYMSIGFLYTFFGYRCFKAIMFLTGFIFASSLVYLLCLQGELMPPYGNAGASLLAGFLFGTITMLAQYVGLFMTGIHTGLLIGLGGLVAADHVIQTSPRGSTWISLGVLLVSALALGLLNLYFKKSLTIVGTSVYGAYLIMVVVVFFTGKLVLMKWAWERATLKPVEPPPCWYSWYFIGAWPTIAVAGALTQFLITGNGIYHDVFAGRKVPRTKHKGRGDARSKKYQYFYRIRTAHGDVVVQNFLQSLQKKSGLEEHQGESSTLQSDATHVTALPDGQLAALTECDYDDGQTEMDSHFEYEKKPGRHRIPDV